MTNRDTPEGYGIDRDENFAFIAGFTSGGAPYGVAWEERAEFESSLRAKAARARLRYAGDGPSEEEELDDDDADADLFEEEWHKYGLANYSIAS
jgi:hypothetical protein